MRNIFLEKSYTKCDRENTPVPFSKKSKLSISLDQYSKFLLFCLNCLPSCLKLSYRPFALTHIKLGLELFSLPIFCMIFKENFFCCYILLLDQVLMSGCLYFLRCWAICVL